MDAAARFWHLSDMALPLSPIPSFALYGEQDAFPDLLHVERIADRAAGLNWTIPPHRHLRLHQFLHLETGEAELTFESQQTRMTGAFVASLPPGTVHGFQFRAGAQGHVVTLPTASWPEIFGPASEIRALMAQPFAEAATNAVATTITRVADAHRQSNGLRRTHLLASVLDLVLALASMRPIPEASRGLPDDRVARFKAQVEARPMMGLRVADCAAALNMTPRHLSRLCLAQTGLCAQQILHGAVLHEACRLLAYTRLQVAQVGHRLGFEDPSYFSRFFMRHMQVTPNAYRARMNA